MELARKSRKAKESRVGGKRYITPLPKPKSKAKAKGKTAVIKHGGTTITYKPKPSPHLKPKTATTVKKPTPVAKKPPPKTPAKTPQKTPPISAKDVAASVKKYGGMKAREGWKARLSDLKHHVLQKAIPATGRALEGFEEDLGSIAHAIGLRKSDKPIRIANVPSVKKSATGLDVLTTLGGLGLGPPKKVTKVVTPARVLAEKGGKVKQTASKVIPKEVKKFYQKHIGSRLSPKMQVTPTKGGTSLGTTTEITTRGLAFGTGTGASKLSKKIRSEARKAVARINKARTGRTGKKKPLTVVEFLKAVMNVKPKVIPKPRRLTTTPATKPRVHYMPTTAKPKPKPAKEGPPKWQSAADKPLTKVPTGKPKRPESAFKGTKSRTGKERPFPGSAKPATKKKSPTKKSVTKKKAAKKKEAKKAVTTGRKKGGQRMMNKKKKK